jgi:hypothetical protein
MITFGVVVFVKIETLGSELLDIFFSIITSETESFLEFLLGVSLFTLFHVFLDDFVVIIDNFCI